MAVIISLLLVPLAGAGSAWSLLGQKFNGTQHSLGHSVALAEETRLTFAVGGPAYSLQYPNQGIVHILQFAESRCLWTPLGNAIVGHNPEDAYGTSLDLSCNGSTSWLDGPHVRQPKGRRGEPLVIQGGSSPETRATCPLGEFGGWNG